MTLNTERWSKRIDDCVDINWVKVSRLGGLRFTKDHKESSTGRRRVPNITTASESHSLRPFNLPFWVDERTDLAP